MRILTSDAGWNTKNMLLNEKKEIISSKQNSTRDTEIKNKRTVTRGEGDSGGKKGRFVKNKYKESMDKAKAGKI